MSKNKNEISNKTAGSDFFKKTVSVTLLKDNYNYKDDVTITYNGTNYQIQRGVPVQVPMFIKLILDDSFRQQIAADSYNEKLVREFQSKTDKMI